MRGFACVALDNPKTPANIGGVFRAAQVYGAALVIVGGKRPAKIWTHIPTDTMKAYRHLPVQRVEDLHEAIPFDCIPVAVDLVEGAESLISFKHPERAMYIFGGEDMTLGDRILSWCKHRVQIPTTGCMNLAACVNVVLYDRMAKGLR